MSSDNSSISGVSHMNIDRDTEKNMFGEEYLGDFSFLLEPLQNRYGRIQEIVTLGTKVCPT